MPFKSVFWGRILFFLGLGILLAYIWSIHPAGFSKGYVEDQCPDLLRQAIAESLDHKGKPTFHNDSFMTPTGVSMPYMSWMIERDWLGAYFWKWNPNFPFMWAYVGVSLLICYLGVGLILRRMKFSSVEAWSWATLVVLFNIPRHFKTWHHIEHLPQHWIYLSFFLDAWIWQRFWKERKWSLHLEFWRGFLLLGIFCGSGYFWGPIIFEWALVRSSILAVWAHRARKGVPSQLQCIPRLLVLPTVLGMILLGIELRWFIELYLEVKQLGGDVYNNLGWFAYFYDPFRPLWLDWIFPIKKFFERSETVSSLGWFWIILFFSSVTYLRKKKKGPGLGIVMPFLMFIIFGYLWESKLMSTVLINFFRRILPFMSFFRVSSRWSLLMPAALGVLIILAWGELKSRAVRAYRTHPRIKKWITAFAVSSLLEFSFLFYPVNMLAPLPIEVSTLMKQVRNHPGTTVLDMPFCVIGGNGVCGQQCPNYPGSTVGLCLRLWHEKKVYGLYQARMSEKHCQIYDSAPYQSWFLAWRDQRCLNDAEWTDFCQYLDQHQELSSVFVYPDIWVGAKDPRCQQKFEAYLGKAWGDAQIPMTPNRGGKYENPGRILIYGAKCLR